MLLSDFLKGIKGSKYLQTKDAGFVESDHPRGQPDNPGQFTAGSGGSSNAPDKEESGKKQASEEKSEPSDFVKNGYKMEKAQKSIQKIFDGVPGGVEPSVFGEKDWFSINCKNKSIDFSMEVHTDKNQIHLGLIKIPKSENGKGLGKSILKNMVSFAQREGISEIHLDADIKIGKYAWAKLGFQFADNDALNEIKDGLQAYCSKNKIRMTAPIMNTLKTPQDFANFESACAVLIYSDCVRSPTTSLPVSALITPD